MTFHGCKPRRSPIIPYRRRKRRRIPGSWLVLGIVVVMLAVSAYEQRYGTGLSPVTTTLTPTIYRVIDGDTVEAASGMKYRLLGYDTPETYQARCDEELARGKKATERLRELLASGEVRLSESGTMDKYGRSLARLTINGTDVGAILIHEGLARPYDGGHRQGWCE